MNNVNNVYTLNSLTEVFLGSFQTFLNQLVIWLPKLLIALIIWWAGNVLLSLVTKGLKWVDIPGMKLDNKLIAKFNKVLLFLGKFLLVLIVLDYLGIADAVIGAVANGLTLTVALILGISFGQSLKPKTDEIVDKLGNQLKKK